MREVSDSVETEIERVNLKSQIPTEERLKQLQDLFPEVFSEGVIDFDKFKHILGEISDLGSERYGLYWQGKADSARVIQQPAATTLAPIPNESVDWENTKNVIIEGENLEVLKLLQRAYNNKIKLIYMDPPYNTGNEFVYKDNYAQGVDQYLLLSGQKDEDGTKFVANPESSGRYHSDWLSMMYPRLQLARSLLRDDGAIFVSIGKEEVANLVLLVKEVFGEENFIGLVTRKTKGGSNYGTHFVPSTDYILVTARDKSKVGEFTVDITDKQKRDYKEKDSKTKRLYKTTPFMATGISSMRGTPNQRYWIECPDGSLCIPPGNVFPPDESDLSKIAPQTRADRIWRWTYETFDSRRSDIKFDIPESGSQLVTPDGTPSKYNVLVKEYLDTALEKGRHPRDLISDPKYLNARGTKDLKNLGLQDQFSFPKPVALLEWCIQMACDEGIVLDLFAGSGATGEAVLRMNAKDDRDRSYILVQLPEETESGDFKNIAEIARERMRRAGEKIKNEGGGGDTRKLLADEKTLPLDLGFRSYKLTDSNFIPWDSLKAAEEEQLEPQLLENNLSETATAESIAFEILLNLGFELASEIVEVEYGGLLYYKVEIDKLLLYVSDDLITIESIEEAIAQAPSQIVLLESCFGSNDELKVNVLQTIRSAKYNGLDIEVRVV